jgi:hypothetical protein
MVGSVKWVKNRCRCLFLFVGVEKNPELAAKYKKIAMEMQDDVQGGKTLSFQVGVTLLNIVQKLLLVCFLM